jgi:hypothetical protein
MPSASDIADMADVYFDHCHMQPLWLFERDEFDSRHQTCPEIVYPMLALTLLHSTSMRFDGREEELSCYYARLAKAHMMTQVTQGVVKESTIQGLCLLALADFMCEQTSRPTSSQC